MNNTAEKSPYNQAFLSLGSNIEAEINLPAAVRKIAQYGRIVRISTVWETTPVGPDGQPNFLNAALWLETRLSAKELKDEAIAEIETALGRVRSSDRFAPRPIDIDIMLFNADRLQLGGGPIPDPEILERPFVVISLAEIAPDYVHPETGETLATIASRFAPVASGMRRRDDVILPLTAG